MAIKLRIVGNFFRMDVDLASGTVKDVLDAAVTQSRPTRTRFRYTVEMKNNLSSPTTFTASYADSFTSSDSGIMYPAGTYSLAEDLDRRPAYTVWQYYLFDADNNFLNRGRGFVPFDDPATTVTSGQSVVWRLVSVLAGPNPGDVNPRG